MTHRIIRLIHLRLALETTNKEKVGCPTAHFSCIIMSMTNTNTLFAIGENYHVFNRGVDKREIFSDKYDVYRFIQSLKEFNRIESGNDIFYVNKNRNIYKSKESKNTVMSSKKSDRLVAIVCYCLNPNHFHLVLEELVDGGVSKFTQRLSGGYSSYYNNKNDRSGALFQGKFKAIHIESNEQLLNTSAYVNLNNKVHKKLEEAKNNFVDLIPNRSSWKEYVENYKFGFCKKDIILGQFKNKKEYEKFAEVTAKTIKEMRYGDEL